jgi:hypothetical protein
VLGRAFVHRSLAGLRDVVGKRHSRLLDDCGMA